MANITAYNPVERNGGLAPFSDPFDELLNGFFMWPATAAPARGVAPLRVDVTESDNAYHVLCEMPGMKKDDISVTVEGNEVTISGEVKNEKQTQDNARVLWSERQYGRVQRTLSLGREIDQAHVQARYADGVLELTLPKTEAAMRKRITIH